MLSPAARNVPAVGPQAYGCLWLWLLTFCPFREVYWSPQSSDGHTLDMDMGSPSVMMDVLNHLNIPDELKNFITTLFTSRCQ